jgi:hypothetical protein
MITDNVWIIQIPENKVSQYYLKQSLPTWENCNVNLFDAYTPKHMPDYLNFGLFWGKRYFSESEKAGFYSHLELWKKCFEEDKPITIVEHDVELQEVGPVVGDFFAMCDFDDDDEWINYSSRFRGHPYWGLESDPLCPVTHAYYMTPDVAESLFYAISEKQVQKFIDDYMWEFMGQDRDKIVNYCSPIYNADVGGTMVHE